MINALILAGTSPQKQGKPKKWKQKTKPGEVDLEKYAQVSNKALIPILEKPMLWFTLEALEGIKPPIREVKLLGEPETLKKVLSHSRWEGLEVIAEKGSLLDNLEEGLQHVNPEEPCLIATSDIPLITSEAVQDFVFRCEPFEKDLYYPIITEVDCTSRFPQTERTYLAIKEGRFTGGNLAMVKPSSILARIDQLHLIFSQRKQPWKYARMLSPRLILKLLFKQVTVEELEFYISRILDWEVSAVRTPYVEIGTDVDKPTDLEMARQEIKEN